MFYEKYLIKIPLLLIAIISFGCASLPDAKAPSFGSLSKDKRVTIKLERVNKKMSEWALFGDNSSIRFGKDINVHIPDEWENTEGGFFTKTVDFNNKAKFEIPPGNHSIRVYILYRNPSPPFTKKRLMVKTSDYNFEPGGKYKIYLFWQVRKLYGSMSYNIRIARIEKVDSI